MLGRVRLSFSLPSEGETRRVRAEREDFFEIVGPAEQFEVCSEVQFH